MTGALWSFLADADGRATVARRGARELSAESLRAAALSLVEELRNGDGPLFLYCEDAANFIAGLLGGLIAGREVLLPAHAAPGYLAEIGAEPANLVTDVSALEGHRVSVGESEADGPLPPVPEGRIGFFTSGTSGAPKLCMKSMRQLDAEVAVLMSLWGTPRGVVLGTVSHQHIYGLLFRVLWPLAAGAVFSSRVHENWESVAVQAAPESVVVSSPAHLGRIPPTVLLSGVPSFIFSSGGLLPAASAQSTFEQFGCWPTEVLGSTETGGVAWRRQSEEDAPWTALPSVELSSSEEGALAVLSSFTGFDAPVTMGDAVVFLEDGRFRLKERLDRIVKIEGKRVSLPRVEDALHALDMVDNALAIDLPDRNGALGAIVVLNGAGRDALAAAGRFRFSRGLRMALKDRLEPMELPRFWRFVDEIPVNAQGKRVASVMRQMFRSPELPEIEAEKVEGDRAEFEFRLQPELKWFEGHFPGQPILPGVAQLHIVALLAERVWGIDFPGHDMSRVKFRRVMQPEERVSLLLVRAELRLDFQYVSGGEVVASGTVRGLA
jgi:acyl-CoA synthetase (AMP-forming)/AMP-acid ligase II/3-hydroxymyristoyl/3-hydroxydecanoyl-(acyl carrier protein) dehydratase